MLTQKKQRRYVQTEAEMQGILNEVGLADARLEPAAVGPTATATAPASPIEGPRLKALLEIVTGLDNALRAFGRRNLPLRSFLARAHAETGLLPLYHVQGFAGTEDAWPYSAEELESYQQPTPRRSRARGTARGWRSPSCTRSGRSTSGSSGSATSSG